MTSISTSGAPSQGRQAFEPIAIVGASALFPGSIGIQGFWKDILAAQDRITDVPESHWLIDDYFDPDPGAEDKTYCKRGGFIPTVDFDPVAFGIPPASIPATDTSQLLALILAHQVLEDAFRAQFDTVDKSRMSVILGVTAGQELLIQAASRLQRPNWIQGLRQAGIAEELIPGICERIAQTYTPWQENTFPGLLGNVVAGRIANRFNLGGTNCITDAACASSLSALAMAIQELHLGHSDVVITGGVDCFNDIFMYMCFSKTPALSRSGDCRPFSDKADGTLMGEGIGMFAVKRLVDAERDGDRIYAVIRGLGSSSDGRAMSVYAPLPQGQARAIGRAYELAGYSTRTVELIEAHGTGTKAGDVAEFEGLRLAFSPDAAKAAPGESSGGEGPWCALGSVKSQIGHTKASAGAAGLFKVLMALHHKVLPPTLKVDRPNPKLQIEQSPFYLNTESRPWVRDDRHPRRAGLSSFGFGGSNFHVTLEEYTGPAQAPARLRATPCELVVLGAPTPEALGEQALDMAALVDATHAPQEMLTWLAWSTQQAFSAADSPVRLSVVARTGAELAQKLRTAAERIANDPKAGFDTPHGISFGIGPVQGELAFVFPGQGSQYVGMGAELALHFEAARTPWDLAARMGLDVHRHAFPQPAFDEDGRQQQTQALTRTEHAQPAIGVASAALLHLLQALGLEAQHLAGHSFGEVTALYAAGALGLEPMLAVAQERGRLMAKASSQTQGAMTAVSLGATALRALIADCGARVVLANDNSPTQVVLSGATDQIALAEMHLAQRKVGFRRLPVATAFHSSIVSQATRPFAEFLETIRVAAPARTAYANAEATAYPEDPELVRYLLASQIANPVRFVEMIQAMYAAGARTFVEVGPANVLTGLVGQCLSGRPHTCIALDRKGASGLESFLQGLGQLAARGHQLAFETLWQGYAVPENPDQKRRPRFAIALNGANHARPYPPAAGASGRALPNLSSPVSATSPSGEHRDDLTPASAATVQAPFQGQPTMATHAIPPAIGALESHTPAPATAPAEPASRLEDTSEVGLETGPMASPHTLEAFVAYQRSLSESHQVYLQTMEKALTEAQMTYMRAMEESFVQWCAMQRGTDPEAPSVAPLFHVKPKAPPVPAATDQAPQVPPQEMRAAQAALQMEAPTQAAARDTELPAATSAPTALPVAPQPLPAIAPAPTTKSVDPALRDLLLGIVADKTGYPQDMLALDMALEADLGIDSIKRVEILAALQEALPQAAHLDPAQLATLRSLGDILAKLDGQAAQPATDAMVTEATASAAPQAAPMASAAPHAPAAPTISAPAPTPQSSAKELLLGIVADKTGYPQDMLELDMALEADLGIDSIKRVEILAALQEALPQAAHLDPAQLATLRSLGDILEKLEPTGVALNEPTGLGQDSEAIDSPAPLSSLAMDDTGAEDLDASPGPTPRTVARHVVGLRLAPATGHTCLDRSAPVLITDDGTGVARALAQELGALGFLARVVSSQESLPHNASQIVFLDGLGPVESASEVLDINRRAFAIARHMARHGASLTSDAPFALVTVQDTGGDFGFSGSAGVRAALGGLAALVKTAQLEWPNAWNKAIDLQRQAVSATEAARLLASELVQGGPEVEVALRPGHSRCTVTAEPVAQSTQGIETSVTGRIDHTSVILASGGARGVTAHCLEALAKTTKAYVVLLGRTPLEDEPAHTRGIEDDAALKRALLEQSRALGEALTPAQLDTRARELRANREVHQTMAAIAESGAGVQYLSVDVRDPDALREALAPVRRERGPITGLVHAAGVLADKLIADKSDEAFERVFSTKVDGLNALLEATREDDLQVVCLFSSVAARTGNLGQCDYAMANEILNKTAHAEARRRAPRAIVKSLGWGPWDGGMVTPGLKSHFERQGVKLIPLADGAQAFVNELMQGDPGEVEVLLGDGLPAAATQVLRTRVTVDRASHPHFEGHRIQEVPVLPAVIVLDWFARSARAASPGLDLRAISDFKVLRGAPLRHFDGEGDSFFVEARHSEPPNGSAMLEMELRSPDGTLHFSARARLSDKATSVPAAPEPPLLPPSPWNAEEAYAEHLFHGAPFQVIEQLDCLSPQAALAHLRTAHAMDWPAMGLEPLGVDPAVLDGGLQLAIVVGVMARQRRSLPTRIGEWRVHALCADGQGEPQALVVCQLHARDISAHRILCDVWFISADGHLLAELSGLEMHFMGEAAAALAPSTAALVEN